MTGLTGLTSKNTNVIKMFHYKKNGQSQEYIPNKDVVLLNANGSVYWSFKAGVSIGLFYISPKFWNRFRRMVFEQKGKICSHCGTTIRLMVHHIIPASVDLSRVFDMDNVIVLCKKCHSLEHVNDNHTWFK